MLRITSEWRMLLFGILWGCSPTAPEVDASVADASTALDGGGGGTSATPDPDLGDSSSTSIGAAGGTLPSPSGTVRLEVPEGALAADTVLSLAVTDPRDGSRAAVYDLGPDGQTFATSVRLRITFDGVPFDGFTPVLATWNGATWEEVPGSYFLGGEVVAPITHFSEYTIVYVSAEGRTLVCDGTTDCPGDATCDTDLGLCVLGTFGAACTSSADCGALICGPFGVCVFPGGLGASCATTAECETGLLCAPMGICLDFASCSARCAPGSCSSPCYCNAELQCSCPSC